jgi:hypothetical protein
LRVALRRASALAAVLAVVLVPGRAGADPLAPGPAPELAWARMPDTAFSLARARESSGTSWQPERGPVPGAFGRFGLWQGALRWGLFLAWLDEPAPRGADRLVAPGFAALEVGRDLGAWRLAARAALSGEPWTVGERGAPLLLRGGAVSGRAPLPDRAPPRPLALELAVLARLELAPGLAAEAYGALAGEPALGPAAATHRLSAAFDPAASVAEDVLGPAPASRGVLTAAVLGRRARLEGSLFGAREAGDDPASPGAPRLDSASARLSVSLAPALVAQASWGSLAASAVPGDPGRTRRASASASWVERAGARGALAITLAVGRDDGGTAPRRAALVEAAAAGDRGAALFGRGEWVERTAAELQLEGLAPDRRLGSGRLSLGASLPLARAGRAVLAAGVRGSLALVPAAAKGAYGTSPRAAVALFVQLRPAFSRGGPFGGHLGEGWGDP